jgi:hypothetical protein
MIWRISFIRFVATLAAVWRLIRNSKNHNAATYDILSKSGPNGDSAKKPGGIQKLRTLLAAKVWLRYQRWPRRSATRRRSSRKQHFTVALGWVAAGQGSKHLHHLRTAQCERPRRF